MVWRGNGGGSLVGSSSATLTTGKIATSNARILHVMACLFT
jgi:hypothetical protein